MQLWFFLEERADGGTEAPQEVPSHRRVGPSTRTGLPGHSGIWKPVWEVGHFIALLKRYERRLMVAVSWWLFYGLSNFLYAFSVFSKIVTVLCTIFIVKQIIKVIEWTILSSMICYLGELVWELNCLSGFLMVKSPEVRPRAAWVTPSSALCHLVGGSRGNGAKVKETGRQLHSCSNLPALAVGKDGGRVSRSSNRLKMNQSAPAAAILHVDQKKKKIDFKV